MNTYLFTLNKKTVMNKKAYTPHTFTPFALMVSLFFALTLTIQGKDISPKRAASIAKKYVKLLHNNEQKAQAGNKNLVTNTPYYIYNDAQGHGFVIVSGDDQMGEVLAYSREQTLDTLKANPCVKLLLAGYKQTYEVLKSGDASVVQSVAHTGLFTQTVSPLLKSQWGQSHPFNAMTGYPYSGCVATAIAQMMYYYQWPAQGYGENEYTVTYYQTTKKADFSQSHYDWANMLPYYQYPVQATAIQENAVARLMNDVGIASFMQYTPNASGTQGIFAYQALQKHFDYTAAYVTKATEGPSRFAEILRQELLNGCPVYLEGRPAGSASGHAWVTDGFDENGLFHMNFGWEGQGDAYFSLTNLSLEQTGSEFQGKPLAFNRAITAILAHPNNGKYPDIDRRLLETSPQLMFNEGGSFTLKEANGKHFNPSQPLTLEMNSFVNKGKPFKGDVGVAVYDTLGNLIHVYYSDDHDVGGLTQRIYGNDKDGLMGTDYLINQPQPIHLSLENLTEGFYRLVPVCVARHEDGTWDEACFPIKRAPIIEVELTNGVGRISEMCAEDAHFQLMAQPRLAEKAEQGRKVHAIFTIKNLNGVPRDCYLRVQLIDDNNTVVFDTRVDELTEIEGFTEAEIPIFLSLPARLTPARYQVRLILSADEAETHFYPINHIHDQYPAYIEVVEAPDKPLIAKAEVFWADDSNDKIASNSLNLSEYSLFKIGISLRTSDDLTYEGPVTMCCEDLLTAAQIQVPGIDDYVSLSSSFDVPLYSYWLRKSNMPWEDGHTYRIKVRGEWEGQEMDLANPQEQTYYLKREGDYLTLYQDVLTQISVTSQSTVNIRQADNNLMVSGKGIRSLKLYNLHGNLLKHATFAETPNAILPLQGIEQGVYLLQIEDRELSYTHKLFKNNASK